MTTTRISILLVAAAITACGGGEKKVDSAGGDTAAPIVLGAADIAIAQVGALGTGLAISGNLDPADVVELRAQVPGVVRNVRADRGSPVRAGSVLAVIEAQGIRSQAAGARAQVAAAQAQLNVAQQRQEAARRLLEAGAISEIEYKTAQANVEAAQAQVAAAQAQAAGAGESAARATVTSPITGVVSARPVNEGEAVNPGASLFTIVNARELELAGRVGVEEASRVRVGQTVVFTLDAFPGEIFRGRVARVDPTADPGTRQVGVYVRLDNSASRIVGGQFARGIIETASAGTAIVVPEAALTDRAADSAAVYVVAGNKLARRSVRLGARDETTGRVAVVSGLQNGERVLLNPSPEVGEGTTVTVATDASAAARDSVR